LPDHQERQPHLLTAQLSATLRRRLITSCRSSGGAIGDGAAAASAAVIGDGAAAASAAAIGDGAAAASAAAIGDGAAAGGSEPAKLTATGRWAGRRKRPAVDFCAAHKRDDSCRCHDGYRVRADRRSDFTWPKSTLGGESVPPGGRDSHTNPSPPERAATSVVVTANPPIAVRRPRVARVV
jgi:hypothetical protein